MDDVVHPPPIIIFWHVGQMDEKEKKSVHDTRKHGSHSLKFNTIPLKISLFRLHVRRFKQIALLLMKSSEAPARRPFWKMDHERWRWKRIRMNGEKGTRHGLGEINLLTHPTATLHRLVININPNHAGTISRQSKGETVSFTLGLKIYYRKWRRRRGGGEAKDNNFTGTWHFSMQSCYYVTSSLHRRSEWAGETQLSCRRLHDVFARR